MATEFVDKQWRIPNSWNVDQSNQGKVSNYSMKFNNASTNFIEFPETDFLKSGQASFSFWSNPNTYGGNNYGYFFSGPLFSNGGLAMSEGGTGGGTYTPGVLYWYNGSASIILDVTLTENVWNHIVIVFDGTTITTYKDGSNPVTTTITAPSELKFNTIGKYFAANSNILNGELDQVCVFDYALSASQVSTLYGNSAAGYFQIGNPMALTPNPVVFYPLGDQDVQQTVDSTDWRIPNQVAGAFSSVFTSGGAAPGGSSATINLANPVPLGSNKTVSFWFKLSSSAQFGFSPFTAAGATAGNCYYPYFLTSTSTVLRWYISDAHCGGTGFNHIGNGGATGVDTWAHAAVVGDGSNVICYLNGAQVQQDSGDRNATIQKLIHAPTQLIEFSNFSIFNTNLSLTGTESITSLYNNGTPPDLTDYSNIIHWWKLNEKDTFNSATGNWTIKDYIGSNNGTSSSMTSASLVSSDLPSVTSGYSPWAIDLDGIDDNFTIDNSSKDLNVENISISTWFFQDDSAAASSYPAIIINGFSGSGGSYWGLVMRPGNIVRAQLKLIDSNGNEAFVVQDITETITTGQWNHIAMTYDGTTLKGYINGVEETLSLVTSAPGVTPIVTSSGPIIYSVPGMNSQDLLIGKRGTDSFRIDGKISNFAIWGSGLTSAQIATIYNNGIPGDISSLNPLAWWELGIMTGFNSGTWTAISNSDSNFTAVSTTNMTESDLVNGPGYSANAIGTSTLVLEKQAPYSFNNALSENMAISNRDDSQASDPYPLMTELDLTGETSSYTFTTPILYTSGDVSIDWGDGSAIQQTGTISNIRLTHVYDTDTYPRPLIQWGKSTDAGKISRFLVNGGGSRLNIFNLKQWGKSFNGIQINFNNAVNMIITAQDIPDFSSLTSMAAMFFRCNNITTIPNIEKWDVSNKAVSAAQMFRFCYKFIATDLDNFADNVFTSQAAMFGNCYLLNSTSFSKWRTRGAMGEAFESMSSLDQDLSTKTVTRADGSTYIAWDISDCTSLFQMLDYNSGFTGTNPNVSNWDTSNLVGAGLGYLFLQAKMNSDISTKQISTPNPYNTTYTAWDVNGVTSFIAFSQSNSIFNQNLRTWQLSESTTTLSQMFTSTAAFSDDNYTDTLVGWAVYLYGVENPPENLSLGNTTGLSFQSNRTVNSDDNGSTTTNYSSLYPSWPETWTQASDARDYLVETLGWSSIGNPL